jgi:short-subunit dehydrogenase
MPPVALVTGASSGIGRELALGLAARGYDLVLVARREAALQALSREVEDRFGRRARILTEDLAAPGAPERIGEWTRREGVAPDVLVNNAGFGLAGHFVELPLDRQLAMIQVNVDSLTRLSRIFLPDMLTRGRGGILNVGSAAGFQPGPFMAVYYATKAFVLSFSEALAEETRGTGVTITCLAPGPVATEFYEVAAAHGGRLTRSRMLGASEVAQAGLEGFRAGKTTVIPGLSIRTGIFAERFAPRVAVRRAVGRLNRGSDPGSPPGPRADRPQRTLGDPSSAGPEMVLVTGAAGGLGREITARFAHDGSALVLVDRDEAGLRKVAQAARAGGAASVHALTTDLSSAEGVDELLDRLRDEEWEIDVLVNNAGLAWSGPVAGQDPRQQEEMLGVNLLALFRLTRALLPGMLSQGRGGILNVGSTAGFQPGPGMGIYFATKAFVNHLTEALAEEVQGMGVTVTLLAPGPLHSAFTTRARLEDTLLMRVGGMDPRKPAAAGVHAFRAGKTLVVPGLRNKIWMSSLRLAPRWLTRRVLGRLLESAGRAQ